MACESMSSMQVQSHWQHICYFWSLYEQPTKRPHKTATKHFSSSNNVINQINEVLA